MKRHPAKKLKPQPFQPLVFFLWIIGCEAIGLLASVVTIPNISGWYIHLLKPSFAPPDWVFGPAWTILYALIGFAGYRVWQRAKTQKHAKTALRLFYLQLFFNFVWSFIFFGAHNIIAGFVDIGAMWVAIILSTLLFDSIDAPAAYAFIPYLAWVSFAVCLNYQLWLLNV